MKLYGLSFRLGLVCAVCLAAFTAPIACHAQEESYPAHPDSIAKDGVPRGEVLGPFRWTSQIYPGTERDYQIYVPAQYTSDKPACVMVVQDGIGRAREWKLPVVFDNLIAEGAMPVTIGIFIEPGVLPAPHANAQPRFNRSFEYDGLGDRYARFLLEEILPEVSKKYALSQDPNDRAIAGASSGAICAWNVAWERPDQFRRVLSTIGTYVGLRGANDCATLVRKTEPKPIRVFLQDGNRDLNIYAGDWWIANQDMLSALTYAGYDVHHVWGEGGHNGKHAAAIMPDALRWLWRDYPQPITAKPHSQGRMNLLKAGDDWQLVQEGLKFADGPAAGLDGDFFVADAGSDNIYRIAVDGKVSTFVSSSGRVSGLMMGDDGYLYACKIGKNQIVRYDMQGKEEVLVNDAPCNDLVVLPHGLYYTDHTNRKIWYVSREGQRKEVDTGIAFPNGLIVSPDHTLLHVADSKGMFTYSFQIQENGDLKYKQEYGHLHCPDGTSESGADGMSMDTEGRLYVATKLGVQVLDQPGRVNLIINKPSPAFLSNIVLGGPDGGWLLATCGGNVYRRHLQAQASYSWQAPTAPPKPGL